MKLTRFNFRDFHFSGLVIPFLLFFSIGFGAKRPATPVVPEKNESRDAWVNARLAAMTTEEKIAQSFMVDCRSNEGESHLQKIENDIRTYKIGGVIFFQGERENLVNAIGRFQAASSVPLLIGMDAEWGVAMRIFKEERFPYAQTIGAANDLKLTEEIGRQMGIECDLLGIHMNFAPVADISSNPSNPVIGFRSFGSSADNVSRHVNAFVRGLESAYVLSCVKHFPGHGDTDKDSHLELPTVSHSREVFQSSDFEPFRSGIAAGTSAVMVAHLNVPALDNTGTPSSLSKPVIQDYLRRELGFKGLVISDALNMKAVSEKYGKSEVVAKAYMAGCDILLYPESVGDAIALIAKKVKSGDISMAEVDAHCRRVLEAKYKAIIGRPVIKRMDPKPVRELTINRVYEKALTVLKNDSNCLPLDNLDRKIAVISIGMNSAPFRESIGRFMKTEQFHYFTVDEALARMAGRDWNSYDVIVADFHASSQRAANNYGFGEWQKLVNALPEKPRVIGMFFGNPGVFRDMESLPANLDACVVAYENHPAAQERAGQFVAGSIDVNGSLQAKLSDKFGFGYGMPVKGNGRLKFTVPEELNIQRSRFDKIDEIAQKAIKAGAFPGCQIVVAVKGKVLYRKSFGTTIYENGDTITDDHLYDIASITKIASSTFSLMKLATDGKFEVNSSLEELLPDLVKGTRYEKLNARDMLTHRAGLTPWIAFYKATVKNGVPDPSIYSREKKDGFSTPVAENLWIRDDYRNVIYNTILSTPLTGKKNYEYSDLGYYFFNKYIEKAGGMPQNEYVQKMLYAPLGLSRITYLPLGKFPLKMIVPTEFDKDFRGELVHGYVHDPGAAMLGGVAGHAGIFATATDLAAVMQLFLNEGQVGDYSLLDSKVVQQYTSCQFCPSNRRGIGFDRPANGGGGPVSRYASQKSFGHSGFTGTLAWADPEYGINYVFLSNRVYPNADNWKIRDMNIRTQIQDAIYEAVLGID